MAGIEVARRTPYEAVFSAEGFDEEGFAAIEREARDSGADLDRREEFVRSNTVADLLGRLVPEGFETGALDRYLEILFHAYHFWRAGRPIYAFEETVVRALVEEPPDLGDWSLTLPHAAQYLELPKNLFWAGVTEGPPEPVEGLFVRVDRETAVDLMVVLGMWPDRPGFSAATLVLPFDAPLTIENAGAFRSPIPGADLAGLYSLGRGEEAVALLARLAWYIEVHPGLLREVEGSEEEGATSLPHRRVGTAESRDE